MVGKAGGSLETYRAEDVFEVVRISRNSVKRFAKIIPKKVLPPRDGNTPIDLSANHPSMLKFKCLLF